MSCAFRPRTRGNSAPNLMKYNEIGNHKRKGGTDEQSLHFWDCAVRPRVRCTRQVHA